MTRFAALLIALFCLAFPLVTDAQAPGLPPRDSNPRPQTGTGTIRGRVVAMQTGQGLRRAQVMLGVAPSPTRPVDTSSPASLPARSS
jgi:hypothetical protein